MADALAGTLLKWLRARFLPAVTVAAVLGGCAPDLTVRRIAPAPRAVAGAAESAEDAAALRTLSARPAAVPDERARAVAGLVDRHAAALLAARGNAVRVEVGEGRALRLRLRRGAGPGGAGPGRFLVLEPASRFVVRGSLEVTRVPGDGVPLVGRMRPVMPVQVPGPVPPVPIEGVHWAVTAVPVFRGGGGDGGDTLDLDLYDPRVTGRYAKPGGGSGALAMDAGPAMALSLARIGRQRRGLRGFLSDADFASAGVYPSHQPSLEKTPVVLVHGLISDPTDFHDLYVRLSNDPAFRQRYQVWFFYYPSSLPVPYSAMLLREDLEEAIRRLDPGGNHPALHRAVLVGHSMGGLLSRLAVSDGGERYYGHFFREPIDRLRLSGEQRALVRRGFFYRASPSVRRVVFVATPHHGSRLAGGMLGSLGRLLVRVPLSVRTNIGRIITDNRHAVVEGTPLKPASSLDSLSPRDPLVAAINDLPIRPDVHLHSILGDRGRGGPPERTSDGVVPYASSHLPQAESERLVPAGHTGTLQRTETAAEIQRLLLAPR